MTVADSGILRRRAELLSWWANPLAALAVALLAAHEGREAWHGEDCC